MSPKGTNNATCFSLPVIRHATQSDAPRLLRVTLQVSNAHTDKDTRTHTFLMPLFWCKMPAPLNHGHNSPRSFGLLLSTLLPEEQTGNIYHEPQDDVMVVRTAVGVIIRSAAENLNPFYCKSLNEKKKHQFPLTMLYNVYTIHGKHLSQSNNTS